MDDLPLVSSAHAEWLAGEHFGIVGHAERLTGERDENFWIRTEVGPGYVLKVANAAEAPEITDLQIAALLHVERVDPGLPCARVLRCKGGRTQVRFVDENGAGRTAVLYSFLPGKPLLHAHRSSVQRVSCGRLLARLGRALRNFEHPASHRVLVWDLRQLPKLQGLLEEVPGLLEAEFIRGFLTDFAARFSPRLATLRAQFVHNDFNARNVIVDPAEESRVVGVIDFGDSVHTALAADVAVGAVGQLAAPDTAEESIREFVGAYCEVEPLNSAELAILPRLIAGRIVQNVVMTSWHRARNPGGAHFDGFDTAYFEWRIALARRLVAGSQ
ncbi:MAG TPA: phosphotransferase [Steroidobacteraceae bacterium]|nr:phosphotransferase [Steroidobacteraceae bacterium]